MSTPEWKRLGFLTPDAWQAQREVWALAARLREALGDVLQALADRTAEPSWGATLAEGAHRCQELARELAREAGADSCQAVDDDGPLRELLATTGEIVGSGHVLSLIAAGYVTLGELALCPIRLLEEVAGPHARLLCGRLTGCEEHRLLARLVTIAHPGPGDLEGLRRLLRHLDGQLVGVYQSWRQTFHTLGVDGEWLAEETLRTAAAARGALGLKVTPADLKAFRP